MRTHSTWTFGGHIEDPVFLELPASLAQGGNGQVVATLGLILDAP